LLAVICATIVETDLSRVRAGTLIGPFVPGSAVVGWGGNFDGQLNIPEGLTNAVAVTCGDVFSQALQADGSVAAWGDIRDGGLRPGIPPG
jgi:hypothetical protein